MDEKLIFHILGIEPTKDESIIKAKYYELLRSVNPEDDPEGFKRLRQAYEEAMELARRSEEEEKKDTPKDDISLWLDKVQQVYWYKDTRNNIEMWKELFHDDVCLALDTSLEVRERFLAYIMGHVYMQQEIWQLIDQEFHIREDMEELKETFPLDFLEYAKYQIEHKTFFTYDDLEILGLDEAEIQLDNYIVGYLRCKSSIDREYYENIWQQIDDLKSHEVYHPYEDVERIRMYIHDGKAEDGKKLAEDLSKRYPEDDYVNYWCGRLFWHLEEWERARECWQGILRIHPDQYNARVGMADYYLKTGKYVKAKKLVMDLLEENGRDDYTMNLMREVNPHLIEYYKRLAKEGILPEEEDSEPHGEIEENEDNAATEDAVCENTPEQVESYEADRAQIYKRNMIEACWCMFQNEQYEETIGELQALSIQEAEPEYYDYVNMMGRCYLGMEQYESAIEYLLKWDEVRKQLVDDGSEKYKKRKSREGFIMSAIGVAYQCLKQYKQAETYLLLGIEKEQDNNTRWSVMDRLSLLYYDMGEYKKCIDVCTRIIQEDPGYYPAYLRRQQAAYKDHNAELVIDDFYSSLRIFTKYYLPYLLAVKVFVAFRQYEDAKKVLELAESEGVHQEMLTLYTIRVHRNLARTDQEYQEALDLCDTLLNELEKKKAEKKEAKTENQTEDEAELTEAELLDREMKSDGMAEDSVEEGEAVFEKILLCMDMERYGTAQELIEQEQKAGRDSTRLRWIQADIFRMDREYQKACDEYEKLKLLLPDEIDILYQHAGCLRKLNRVEEAIAEYEEVVRRDPEHTRVHHALMEIFSKRYDSYELKTAYGRALKEATEQLKLVQNAYYYIERGLLYMDNFNFDLALADYQKALEYEPNNIYAYNNIGFVYQAQGQFEEALSYYEKSIARMGEEWTLLPYTNSSKCYEALGKWNEAMKVLNDALEHFKPSGSIYHRLIKIALRMRDVKRVTELCERAKELKVISESDYYDYLSAIQVLTGNLKKGKNILIRYKSVADAKKMTSKRDFQEKAEASQMLGTFFFYHRELKRAILYLDESLKIRKKNGLDWGMTGRYLAIAYYLTRQWGKAKKMATETLSYMLTGNHIPEALREAEPENPESLEYFFSYRALAPIRLFQVAEIQIALGNLDQAEALLKRGQKIPRCRHCAFRTCYDSWLAQAIIEEVKGNKAKAIQLYRQAGSENPSDTEPVLLLDVYAGRKADADDSRN